ncbi:type II toxin-antitoxin system HigB family toxin [Acaryochloris sp. IP29b_bin.137]|uniref:type II toxin-antitoxin system HigB family toxin n=1 Tax=Acaryochloris sp. IP29b_bin.137 TaxID=2969217 RepID=UPI002631EE44|nr:type II toxin-antitoxin system HigB family toxin [Acaryochloris sp. IP29b_bin.137]
MHVISRKILRYFCNKHADSCDALFAWYRVATKAEWQNLTQVQTLYPKAEAVGNFTVFNIKGNTYRLIVDINYAKQRIYIKYILTHSEYDKNFWKNDPYF